MYGSELAAVSVPVHRAEKVSASVIAGPGVPSPQSKSIGGIHAGDRRRGQRGVVEVRRLQPRGRRGGVSEDGLEPVEARLHPPRRGAGRQPSGVERRAVRTASAAVEVAVVGDPVGHLGVLHEVPAGAVRRQAPVRRDAALPFREHVELGARGGALAHVVGERAVDDPQPVAGQRPRAGGPRRDDGHVVRGHRAVAEADRVGAAHARVVVVRAHGEVAALTEARDHDALPAVRRRTGAQRAHRAAVAGRVEDARRLAVERRGLDPEQRVVGDGGGDESARGHLLDEQRGLGAVEDAARRREVHEHGMGPAARGLATGDRRAARAALAPGLVGDVPLREGNRIVCRGGGGCADRQRDERDDCHEDGAVPTGGAGRRQAVSRR